MTGPAVARGFTLIEVLVALVIVAFGVGALLTTLTSSADTVVHLRDKSFAEWIALNRLSELRLARARPDVGTSSGDVEFAGERWRWQQEVVDPGIAGILRVDVRVSREPVGDAQTDDAPAALATAIGFIGQALASSSGIEPNWSYEAAPALPDDPPGDGQITQ